MSDGTNPTGAPTRRDYLTYGGAVVGGGLLAGCTSQSDSGSSSTETNTDGELTATGTSRPEAQSYSVTMEPVGTVEFNEVPQSVAPFTADYIDMMVALGHGDAAESIWYQGRYKTIHYDELDGVSMDPSSLTQLWNDGVDKELFYEMDADLHLIDPHALTDWFQVWSQDDLDEIRTSVAPFIGNMIFRRTDAWHDYRYYTLYEAFEKVAEIFQEQARFEAIKTMHEELVTNIQTRLPGPDERPNAALVFGGKAPEEFSPYRLSGNGANKEQFHTLGLSDAFAGTGINGLSTSDTGTIDYETLLEVDPDSLLVRYHEKGLTREEFEEAVVQHMKDHPVGSELTAVQNDMVFRGGPIYSGPLHNLFLLERYATAYFPEQFPEEDLVDRDRLASIITDGVDE
jgi:iron complex transport system substrate-binding protein